MSKILVIDDEKEVREALKRRLERDGYEVHLAGSRGEGVKAIAEANESFDVIVTDMLMETPESGIGIIKAAAERDIFTEVIVLTAYGNVANAVECMRHGAFDYVEKNIPGVDVYELLMMKIEQALDRREESQSTFRNIQQVVGGIPEAEQAAKAWAKAFHQFPPANPND
jgi:DNA-binding NtrC family response regulator